MVVTLRFVRYDLAMSIAILVCEPHELADRDSDGPVDPAWLDSPVCDELVEFPD
jgi:hypothetical protein